MGNLKVSTNCYKNGVIYLHEKRHPKENRKIVRNFILLRAKVERVKILA